MSHTPVKITLQDMESQDPQPLPSAVLRVLCALSFCVLIGLFVGKVDIVAEAPGKLIPTSFVKIVQPPEAGLINKILVKEGQFVTKGQSLVTLDPVAANADLTSINTDTADIQLRLRRIQAELTGTSFVIGPNDDSSLFDRTYSHYLARKQAHASQLSQEKAGLEKLSADLQAAEQIRLKLQESLPLYQQEAADFEDLAKAGARPEIDALVKRREALEKAKELEAQKYTIEGIKAAMRQVQRKVEQVEADYQKELRQEQTELQSRLNKSNQEGVKQAHKANLLNLTAPADGYVKEIAVHSPGTVVSPGAVILTIVPAKEALLAEIWLKNEDAGFVYVGQPVQVKVATFPFQKYGLLRGKISVISPDASDSSNSTSNGSPAINTQSSAQSAQSNAGQFKVLVALDSQQLSAQGKSFEMKPGMQVTGEIHQGNRTVFEYMTSPVKKAIHEAARER